MTRTLPFFVLACAVVGGVALGLGVLIGQNRQPVEELAGPPAETLEPATPRPSPSPESPGPERPLADAHAVIQAAINARDTATLKQHMAETVTYAVSATECCGALPRGKALAQLRGSLDAGPYDFSSGNLRVRALATNLSDYHIGVASQEVLAYRLNTAQKIDAISTADLRLFGPAAP